MLGQHVHSLRQTSGLKRFPDEIRRKQQQIDEYETRIQTSVQRSFVVQQQRFTALNQHFTSLHPLQPLERGFALVRREGRIVAGVESLNTGETIELVRKNQTIQAIVE
jgi:exodeoxyribonuclease VII large subunit